MIIYSLNLVNKYTGISINNVKSALVYSVEGNVSVTFIAKLVKNSDDAVTCEKYCDCRKCV